MRECPLGSSRVECWTRSPIVNFNPLQHKQNSKGKQVETYHPIFIEVNIRLGTAVNANKRGGGGRKISFSAGLLGEWGPEETPRSTSTYLYDRSQLGFLNTNSFGL